MLGTTELKWLWGHFPCISHKSNPWKTGTAKVCKNIPIQPQIMRVTSQKNPKFARNHWAKEVIRLFSMYITKIKPLENGDYEVYTHIPLHKQKKNPKYARNHWAKGVMRSFSMYITQIKPLENGDYESVVKRPLQSQIMRVTSQKFENLLRTTKRKGICGGFPCISKMNDFWSELLKK